MYIMNTHVIDVLCYNIVYISLFALPNMSVFLYIVCAAVHAPARLPPRSGATSPTRSTTPASGLPWAARWWRTTGARCRPGRRGCRGASASTGRCASPAPCCGSRPAWAPRSGWRRSRRALGMQLNQLSLPLPVEPRLPPAHHNVFSSRRRCHGEPNCLLGIEFLFRNLQYGIRLPLGRGRGNTNSFFCVVSSFGKICVFLPFSCGSFPPW